MALRHSWRNFRRMQHTTLAVAMLIYAFSVLRAWQVPMVGHALKLARTALFPAAFLLVSLAAVLGVPMLRAALLRHLWASYRSGFGQSVISVLAGVGVMLVLAGFILWQVHQANQGGRYPGGAFSGYAAGIGLLIAQAILVRRMEADPKLRLWIDDQG
jgi:hypothetical protein